MRMLVWASGGDFRRYAIWHPAPHHGIIISEANRRIIRNRKEINEVRGVQR